MGYPNHVAIIMDGNGRWAEQRHLPRFEGHRRGVESVREVIGQCLKKGIPVLTLFAFSTENWQRPEKEVHYLFDLFLSALNREAKKMRQDGICMRVVGDTAAFPEKLQKAIRAAEVITDQDDNTRLFLNIAANYSGRWDIVQATKKIALLIQKGLLDPDDITESSVAQQMAFSTMPPPDLFIRTSGEIRISNFLLWDLAYTELYFTEEYWPNFRKEAFEQALEAYQMRERRFGGESTNVS